MPHVFGHDSNLKWSARQELHLRSLGSRPSMLLLHHALFAPVRTEHTGDLFSWGMRDPHTLNLSPAVRFLKLALSMGLAPTLFPQTTGCFSIQLREQNGLPAEALRRRHARPPSRRRYGGHPSLEPTDAGSERRRVGSAGPRFAKRTSMIGQLTCGGTGSSNAPGASARALFCFVTLVALRKQFTGRQSDHFPKMVAGVGVTPT